MRTDAQPQCTDTVLRGLPAGASAATFRVSRDRYTSPAFLQLEMEKLWSRTWQMVCREEDLPSPHGYLEYCIGDQSIIIVRDSSATLRAFFNVCIHRGRKLVSGTGRRTELRCPYHTWTYDLDGTLKSVPSPDEFPSTESYCLPQCSVDTWGGFIFVSLATDAEPLADFIGDAHLPLAPFRLGDAGVTRWSWVRLACNWKTAVETFAESYHVSGIHPQILPVADDVNTRYELFGKHARMVMPIATPSPRSRETDADKVVEMFIRGLNSQATVDEAIADRQGAFVQQVVDTSERDGTAPRDALAKVTRQVGEARGLDLSGLHDNDLVNLHAWSIFPNLQLVISGSEAICYRARPDGTDPDSCIFDVFYLTLLPHGAVKRPTTKTYVPNAAEHDFGELLNQDFRNLPLVQQGMHARPLDTLLLGEYQELGIRHLHETITAYVSA